MVLEDIILRHCLYVATDTNHTYHHLPNCENSGKSTVDLTPIRGIKNISIKILNIEETNIKTRHKAMVIHVGENNIKSPKTTHFRTKNAKWDQWQTFLKTTF